MKGLLFLGLGLIAFWALPLVTHLEAGSRLVILLFLGFYALAAYAALRSSAHRQRPVS